MGIAGDIQAMPWARGYKLLSSKPNVVLFSTARTQEREHLFHWVGTLYAFRLGFFARISDALRIDSLEAAKQVGTIGTYKDAFRQQLLKSLVFTTRRFNGKRTWPMTFSIFPAPRSTSQKL